MSADFGEQTGAQLFSNNISTTNLSQHCCTYQLGNPPVFCGTASTWMQSSDCFHLLMWITIHKDGQGDSKSSWHNQGRNQHRLLCCFSTNTELLLGCAGAQHSTQLPEQCPTGFSLTLGRTAQLGTANPARSCSVLPGLRKRPGKIYQGYSAATEV